MSFNITIVRHAETDYNRNHLIHTHSDGDINENGAKQAELLGSHLANEKFTKVYSSDMQRTQSTAKKIFAQLVHPVPNMILDKKLRERSYGEWEGRHGRDIFIEAIKTGVEVHEFTPPGAETFEDSMKRIIKFIEELCMHCDNSTDEEHILIVTHGLWLIYFFRHLQATDEFEIENFDWNLKVNGPPNNTCKTQFTLSKSTNGKRKIVFSSITDVGHLKDSECMSMKIDYRK